MDPPRRPRHVETERAGHVLLDAAARGLPIQAHASAQEELGVEIAEQEVRVRHCREPAPEVVAGGTGVGPGAVRSDLQEAHPVHARDRPTARADLDQLDDGDADREPRALLEPVGARHLELAPDEWDALVDNARLRGRAAHVERDELRFTALAPRPRGRPRAGGGTGLDEADREAAREGRGPAAPPGMPDGEGGRG